MSDKRSKKIKLPTDPRLYIAAGILLVSSANFFYADAASNIRHGIIFWDALFSGRIGSFYSLCDESISQGLAVHHCTFELLQAVIMALWQLPLYIAEKIAGGNILDFFIARLYGKLYTLVFAFMSAEALKKTAKEKGADAEKQAEISFMFLTGAMCVLTAGVIGQVDIMGTYFLIKCIHAVMKKDDRMLVIWLILAAQCKVFALFFMLPVLLLTEKNILKLMIKAGTPVVFNFVSGLPYRFSDPAGLLGKKERLDSMVACMLENRVRLWSVDIPVFFLFFSAVCIFAWLKDCDAGRNERILWVGLTGGLALLSPIENGVYDYWFIYLCPFVLLLINDENCGYRVLLADTVCEWAFLAANIFTLRMTFDATEGMLSEIIAGGRTKGFDINSLYYKFGHESYHGAWTASWAVFTMGLIMLLIMSFPWREKSGISDKRKEGRDVLMYVRAAGVFVLCNIAAVFNLIGR